MKFIRLSQGQGEVRVGLLQIAAMLPAADGKTEIVLVGFARLVVDQSPETVSMLIDLAVRGGEAHEDIIAEPPRIWVDRTEP